MASLKRDCKPGSVCASRRRMIIHLDPPLPAGSCSLPGSCDETSRFVTVSPYVFRTFPLPSLFGLAPRRDCLVSPPPEAGLVSVALISGFAGNDPERCAASRGIILILRWTGVTRYAAIWSPDFPLPRLKRGSDHPSHFNEH